MYTIGSSNLADRKKKVKYEGVFKYRDGGDIGHYRKELSVTDRRTYQT